MAKSGMRVSEASPGARGPGRGESPAASNKKLAIHSFTNINFAAKVRDSMFSYSQRHAERKTKFFGCKVVSNSVCALACLRVCHEPWVV